MLNRHASVNRDHIVLKHYSWMLRRDLYLARLLTFLKGEEEAMFKNKLTTKKINITKGNDHFI